MPIRRSVQAYQTATPIEQAMWTLAAVPMAIIVPALLRWMMASLADAGRGYAGIPALASRMAVRATETLVHWAGIGILGALAMFCVAMAAACLRDSRGPRGIPTWVVAETYVAAAIVAGAGVLWLA